MIEGLRKRYNYILSPVAKLAVRAHIHPDFITLTGVFLFACSGYLIWQDRWKTAALFVAFGGIMDGLDGAAAREYGSGSLFGSILDSFCDRVTEALLFGGIIVWYAVSPDINGMTGASLALLSLVLSFLISYIRARAEGAGLICKSGIIQRPERLILVAGLLLLKKEIMVYGLGLIAILSFITVLQRLREVRIEAAAAARQRLDAEDR